MLERTAALVFPFLFGGTFIEGSQASTAGRHTSGISLPFRKGFH